MENMVNPAAHPSVARVQALRNLHGIRMKNSCTLCSAVAYCCGAVAPCAIAALLGRFLPRLGPLANASGPFFFSLFFGLSFFPDFSFFLRSLSCRFHAKAAAWNIQEPEYSRTGIFKNRNIQELEYSGAAIFKVWNFEIPSSIQRHRKGAIPRSIRRRPGTARDHRTAR